MIKNLSNKEWQDALSYFNDLVAIKEYDKISYPTWKKLVKQKETITLIFYASGVGVTIGNDVIGVFFYNDRSFGEYLYRNLLIDEDSNMTIKTTGVANLDSSIVATYTNKTDCTPLETTLAATTTISKDLYNAFDKVGANSVCITHEIDNLTDALKNVAKDVESLKVERKDKNMKNFNFDFGPCTNDQCHVSMYGIAVKNAAGVYVSYNPNTKEIVDVDILNFEGAKYMYKIPVALKDVAVGDVIIHNRKPMFVISLSTDGSNTLTCIDVCAGEQKTVVPTVNFFGFSFITKIVSLFNMMGNNAPSPDQPFGNMLPLMLMAGDNKDIDHMMMVMLMSGNNMMNNPMMLYLLAKDNKDIDPMVFMAMSGMFTQPHVCSCGAQKA